MSTIPEGATHARLDHKCFSTGGVQYYRLKHGKWFFWGEAIKSGWTSCVRPCGPVEQLASQWAGEGRPPVGSTVERRFLDHGEKWSEITVLCHGKNTIYYRDRNGTEWSHYVNDLEFRPIRTPEQIAAEKREKAIESIQKDLHCSRAMAEDIFDAGYHK